MSELRRNPLTGVWMATATHRQDRTFLPPAGFCPLCPTKPGGFPTEVPEEDYDIVVFENRFPSMQRNPPEPEVRPEGLFEVAPSQGVCEVVLYSSQHKSTLGAQPIEQIAKLVEVWTDRFVELGARDFVKYVFIFENRGEQIGVTLTHPHGQIYAYPFVPPLIAQELSMFEAHKQSHGSCLLCDLVRQELTSGVRIISVTDTILAYVPFAAGWPYEVHIVPRRHSTALPELTTEERYDLAVTLKRVLLAYDDVFGRVMPYIMAMHAAPTDGNDYSHYHFHIELYPALRTADKLKYLAGSETGAGMYINDTLPETTASTLRKLIQERAIA